MQIATLSARETLHFALGKYLLNLRPWLRHEGLVLGYAIHKGGFVVNPVKLVGDGSINGDLNGAGREFGDHDANGSGGNGRRVAADRTRRPRNSRSGRRHRSRSRHRAAGEPPRQRADTLPDSRLRPAGNSIHDVLFECHLAPAASSARHAGGLPLIRMDPDVHSRFRIDAF